MEQRITPEASSRLHQSRHSSYQRIHNERIEAQSLPDERLLSRLERLLSHDAVFMSRRTLLRVELRALAEEARVRGLTPRKE